MNRITIETDKDAYAPGETIRIHLVLELDKPTQARQLVVGLSWREKKRSTGYTALSPDEIRRMRELGLEPTTTIRPTSREEEGERLMDQDLLAGEGEFRSGEYGVELNLPSDARPTSYEMGHDDRVDVWKVRAKLDIPMGLDIGAEKEIVVTG